MSALIKVKISIRNNPFIFENIWKYKEKPWLKARVIRKGDAALIEGYPRSANTFASVGFEITQSDGLLFGNHFHNPAQFYLAKRYGIPAMLVIREPMAAALSWVTFHDGAVTPYEALYRYVAFHRPLHALAGTFLVAPFEEVTSDFGATIQRFNKMFGTHFSAFEHEKDEQRVFDVIDERRRALISAGHRGENPFRITKPSEEKNRRSNELKSLFNDPRLDRIKNKAEIEYNKIMGLL